MADPLKGFTPEDWAEATKVGCNVHPVRSTPLRSASACEDPFVNVPADVVMMILTMMSTPDVCNLRLASVAVAQASHAADLPQSFWSSRFAERFEMAFILAGRPRSDTRQTLDWRGLYDVISITTWKCPGSGVEGLPNTGFISKVRFVSSMGVTKEFQLGDSPVTSEMKCSEYRCDEPVGFEICNPCVLTLADNHSLELSGPLTTCMTKFKLSVRTNY